MLDPEEEEVNEVSSDNDGIQFDKKAHKRSKKDWLGCKSINSLTNESLFFRNTRIIFACTLNKIMNSDYNKTMSHVFAIKSNSYTTTVQLYSHIDTCCA